jgi:hypothetical protein
MYIHSRGHLPWKGKRISKDNPRHEGTFYVNKTKQGSGSSLMVSGPEVLSYYQAAEILSKATGKKIRYVNVSEEEYRQAMKDSDIGDWWINVVMEVYELYKGGKQEQISSAIEEVTGKKPISFSKFAKDYAQAFN